MDKQQPIKLSIFKKVAGILLAGLFAASPAGAQEESRVIDEILVTAQKREENIQDIGLSITALNADDLAASGIDDVTRLNFGVTGLIFSDVGNDAKFAIRGANSTNTFADNTSIIGAYVDGVYKPRASQQTRSFFDVERLEFLKGPQGTLYGRNTFAGALNLHTNKPNQDGVSGGVKASIESYSTMRMEAFINAPLSESTAIRVAAYTESGDGFIENTAGPDLGAPDAKGVRVSALFQPSEELDILLRFQRVEESGTTAGLFGYLQTCRRTTSTGITDVFGAVLDCQNSQRGSYGLPVYDGNEYQVSRDWVPDNNTTETVVSLDINWDAGPVSVRSITSYTDYTNEILEDFDYSATQANIGGYDEYLTSQTQEIIISSNSDGALQWTAGAYYSEDDHDNMFWIYNASTQNNGVRPVVDGYTILNGTPLLSTEIVLGGAFADNNVIEATTMALFAQGEFSVSDNLRLIAGIRANDEDKDAHGGGSNFTANGPVSSILGSGADGRIPVTRLTAFSYNEDAPGSATHSASFSNTSWRAGVEFDLNDNAMVYLAATNGFLSGSMDNSGGNTDEIESEMIEIGIKSILLDGRMQLNASYHSTDYTNLLAQLQVPNEVGGIVTTTINGGDISATGLEIDMLYVPTDALTLGLGAAFLDAEFGLFGQTPPTQLNNGVPSTFELQTGNTPGWSPDLVLNLSAAYDISLSGGATLTPSIRVYYTDEYSTGNLYVLDPQVIQDSFTKTDFRLTWLSAEGDYTVAAYVENAGDEAVLSRTNYNSQDAVQTGFLYPRNYGVSFQMRW